MKRHVVTITFENGNKAMIVVDENHEVSVRGLQHIAKVEYLSAARGDSA